MYSLGDICMDQLKLHPVYNLIYFLNRNFVLSQRDRGILIKIPNLL